MLRQTVLVTGYGGFLGAAIARKLIQAGYRVRGLARGKYADLAALGVECIQGDVTQPHVIDQAVAGCDAVVHTAALAGVWGPWQKYYAVNTEATSRLLEAAVAARCQAFVFTSSPSVTFAGENQSGIDETVPYPTRWLCNYPHTKALAEQAVLLAAQNNVIWSCALRPHLIWGKGDPHLMPRVIQRARSGRLRRVGSGKNLIDIVHVDNAADAHLLALEKLLTQDTRVNGQAFFITDGKPIECWEWITRILQCANMPVPVRSISYSSAYRIGAVLEWIYGTAHITSEPPMTRFVAAQLAMDHYFSIDKARRLLGYDPFDAMQTRLEECRQWLGT